MKNRDKTRQLFIELINYQLKDHGVTYDDVKNQPNWFMNYKTTPEKQKEFINYIVEQCKSVLKLNTKMAENEASWFILQWGLTIDSSEYEKAEKQQTEVKKKLS